MLRSSPLIKRSLETVIIGGVATPGAHPTPLPLLNKHGLVHETDVSTASSAQISAAFETALSTGEAEMAALPLPARRAILLEAADAIEEASAEFVAMVSAEAGKSEAMAGVEVARTINTFRIAADAVGSSHSLEEAGRLGGRVPVGSPVHEYVRRPFPLGLLSLITPFNFPLNLAAHKIAPAVAAGCPFVLKPSPATPGTASLLGHVLATQTGLGTIPGAMSVLPAQDEDAHLFSEAEGIKAISFTGSPAVGWAIKASGPGKGRAKVLLELGGNAACIVDQGADVAAAVDGIVPAGFGQAGQSCISVQNVFAHVSLIDDLSDRLVQAVSGKQRGDPADESTFLTPMISPVAAASLSDKIQDAIGGSGRPGWKALLGGSVPEPGSNVLEPTILAGPSGMEAMEAPVAATEAFGPLINVLPFDDLETTFEVINSSPFGLQAGIFTPSLHAAHAAYNTLRMGGVVINDVPTTRMDAMPYGGVKDSGCGFEGPIYAIDEFSEPRLMVIKHPQ